MFSPFCESYSLFILRGTVSGGKQLLNMPKCIGTRLKDIYTKAYILSEVQNGNVVLERGVNKSALTAAHLPCYEKLILSLDELLRTSEEVTLKLSNLGYPS